MAALGVFSRKYGGRVGYGPFVVDDFVGVVIDSIVALVDASPALLWWLLAPFYFCAFFSPLHSRGDSSCQAEV